MSDNNYNEMYQAPQNNQQQGQGDNGKKKKSGKGCLVAVAVFFVLGAIGGCISALSGGDDNGMSNDSSIVDAAPATDAETEEATESETEEEIVETDENKDYERDVDRSNPVLITAENFIGAFVNDEETAESEYKDGVFEITGTFEKEYFNTIEMPEYSGYKILFEFTDEEKEKVPQSLRNGDTIIIQGRFAYMIGTSLFIEESQLIDCSASGEENGADLYTPEFIQSLLLLSMQQGYGDNCDVTYDESSNCYVISVWMDGIAEASVLAKEGDKTNWDNMVETMEDSTKTLYETVIDLDSNAHVSMNVLNNLSKDKTLLTILDGITIYDVVDS